MGALWDTFLDALLAGAASLSSALSARRVRAQSACSPSFSLRHARDARELQQLLQVYSAQLSADAKILAEARLRGSMLFLHAIYSCIAQIRSEERRLRELCRMLLASRYRRTFTRFSIPVSDAEASAKAERAHVLADALAEISAVMSQFAGLHAEAMYAIRVSRSRAQSDDDLLRAVLTACRQTDVFITAALECTSIADVRKRIGIGVRNLVVGNVTMTATVTTSHTAAVQLGQLWNRAGMSSVVLQTPHVTSSKDLRMALQMLRKELDNSLRATTHIWKAVEIDVGRAWSFQKYSLVYGELLLGAAAISRAICAKSAYLGGTGELERAVKVGSESITRFAMRNVVEPTTGLYRQVFKNTLSAASMHSVAQANYTLRNMLLDYTKDHLQNIPEAINAAEEGSMVHVMDSYVTLVRKPFRHFMLGNLAQAMLLQVQKLKCDVEELMVKSKQQLQAQELNLALLALIPAVFLVASTALLASRVIKAWRSRGTELVVSPEQTVRFLLGNIYDVLILLREESASTTSASNSGNDLESTLLHLRRIGELHFGFYEVKELIDRKVLRAPPKVLERFIEDIEVLEAYNVSLDSKIRHLHKIWSCYPFFIPLNAT